MPIINNQRPGVYSRYDTASAYAPPRAARHAAVVAKASGGELGRLVEIQTMAQLAEAFPADGAGASLRGCVRILLQSGVGRVYAVAVDGEDYPGALALVEGLDGIGAVVCDGGSAAHAALKESVVRSSDALRERLGFCGADDPAAALSGAGALNSERVVLCCPAVRPAGGGNAHPAYGAAAMAGLILARNNPAWNFSGETLELVEGPPRLPEATVQALLAAGVTLLEESGGAVECVRVMTTRTKSGGETDYALRGVNGVLCIDDVMQAMRGALKAAMRGQRLAGGSLEAVRSQVVVVLADKQDSGVLESYEAPKVTVHSADPTVCVVELAFRIAHVVSQIHVTAHIQV